MDVKYNRRRFLKQTGKYCVVMAASASGLSLLSGCGGKKEETSQALPGQLKSALDLAQEAADPCNNTSDLSEAALVTRENFEYESRSPDGTELCNTCDYWRPSPKDNLCGTCTIVKGPIHPLGTCVSWEEIG